MTDFPDLSFDRMTEADVREELLAPLLRLLGYQSGTQHDILRELSLRYPRVFLGRKNATQDPLLRGRADYVIEVDRRVRWVIEAKAPSETITIDDIEQAWTYANHAEVRAVYFVICNGRDFVVFRTQQAPIAGAVLSLKYEQLTDQFGTLANLLAPTAIDRDFPATEGVGPPLGPGLRSIARIATGIIRYTKSTVDAPIMSQLQVVVTSGAIERDEAGLLVAFLETQSPLRTLQELNERLGLHKFEMLSEGGVLSVDPAQPTDFIYSRTVIYPEGEQLFNPRSWETLILPVAVTCNVVAKASGVLREDVFEGDFLTIAGFAQLELPEMRTEGSFSIRLV